jgi:hypothetical protein
VAVQRDMPVACSSVGLRTPKLLQFYYSACEHPQQELSGGHSVVSALRQRHLH